MRSTASRSCWLMPTRWAYPSETLSRPLAPAEAVTSDASVRRMLLPILARRSSPPAGFLAAVLLAKIHPRTAAAVRTSSHPPSFLSTSSASPNFSSATTGSREVFPERSLAVVAWTYTVSAATSPATRLATKIMLTNVSRPCRSMRSSLRSFSRQLVHAIPLGRRRICEVGFRPGQIDSRGSVGGVLRQDLLKSSYGAAKVPALVRGEPFMIEPHRLPFGGGEHALSRQQLVDHHRFPLALHPQQIHFPGFDLATSQIIGAGAQENEGVVVLVRALQAGCQVHVVAHGSILHPGLRPHVADDDRAGIDPDPCRDLRIALGLPYLSQPDQGFLTLQRCMTGQRGMVRIAARRPEDRHDA